MLLAVLITGDPSITNNGWLSLDNEAAPLTLMFTVEPATPVELIFTPDTLPERAFKTFSWGTLSRASPPTSLTEYPKDFFSLEIPRAVTTTSSNCSDEVAMVTFRVDWLPTTTSFVSIPK